MTTQPISIDVLLEKYAKGEERTLEEVQRRVARALAAVEREPAAWEPRFLDAMRGGFIPAGRVMSAAGPLVKIQSNPGSALSMQTIRLRMWMFAEVFAVSSTTAPDAPQLPTKFGTLRLCRAI